MATDFSEKRSFYRMPVECQLEYDENGHHETRIGYVKNLSGDGILFHADHPIPVGTEMHITVKAGSSLTPPLEAEIEVIRCELTDDEDIFAIAATMKETDAS